MVQREEEGMARGCLCLCEGNIGVTGSVPHDSTAESALFIFTLSSLRFSLK